MCACVCFERESATDEGTWMVLIVIRIFKHWVATISLLWWSESIMLQNECATVYVSHQKCHTMHIAISLRSEPLKALLYTNTVFVKRSTGKSKCWIFIWMPFTAFSYVEASFFWVRSVRALSVLLLLLFFFFCLVRSGFWFILSFAIRCAQTNQEEFSVRVQIVENRFAVHCSKYAPGHKTLHTLFLTVSVCTNVHCTQGIGHIHTLLHW